MENPSPPRSILGVIQARIISGLFVALPVIITFWIVFWLYISFHEYILDPIFRWFERLLTNETFAALPSWWDDFIAPIVAILLALSFLYFLGLFVRSRMYRLFNSLIARVPVVATIYQAVRNLFEGLEKQRHAPPTSRVVLVAFPHPGMRSLGVVTNSLRDAQTQKTILCVCVLTGVVPPAGFTLFVPEENVTDTPWTMNNLVQAILSGGLTLPTNIPYHPAPPPPATGDGPVVPVTTESPRPD